MKYTDDQDIKELSADGRRERLLPCKELLVILFICILILLREYFLHDIF